MAWFFITEYALLFRSLEDVGFEAVLDLLEEIIRPGRIDAAEHKIGRVIFQCGAQ